MAPGSTQTLVSTRNIPGGKGGRCVRLTTSPHSRNECHEIWEPKPPGTLWTTPGLLRDRFTFICCKHNACNHQPLLVTLANNFCFHLHYSLSFFTDEERMKRIFIQCRGRMEIAKSVLDMYFTVRTHIPEVLSNRDPFSQWFKDLSERM
jgi:hypothetical protein